MGVVSRETYESLPLGGGDRQPVSEPLTHLARRTKLVRFDLVDRHGCIADPLRQLRLSQVEGLATSPHPASKRKVGISCGPAMRVHERSWMYQFLYRRLYH